MKSTQKGVGDLQIYHVFVDGLILNNRSIVHFCGWLSKMVNICGRYKRMTPKANN